MTSATPAIAQRGSQTSAASATIETPITQITPAVNSWKGPRLKVQPSRTMVNSIRMSHRPRTNKKRLVSAVPRPLP